MIVRDLAVGEKTLEEMLYTAFAWRPWRRVEPGDALGRMILDLA